PTVRLNSKPLPLEVFPKLFKTLSGETIVTFPLPPHCFHISYGGLVENLENFKGLLQIFRGNLNC
ncbi:MAG: hypothetical protein DSZ31_05985, partial [Gammaproteobacteria bacterium]